MVIYQNFRTLELLKKKTYLRICLNNGSFIVAEEASKGQSPPSHMLNLVSATAWTTQGKFEFLSPNQIPIHLHGARARWYVWSIYVMVVYDVVSHSGL